MFIVGLNSWKLEEQLQKNRSFYRKKKNLYFILKGKYLCLGQEKIILYVDRVDSKYMFEINFIK